MPPGVARGKTRGQTYHWRSASMENLANGHSPAQQTTYFDDLLPRNSITRPAENGDAHLVGRRVSPRALLLVNIIPVVGKGLFRPFWG